MLDERNNLKKLNASDEKVEKQEQKKENSKELEEVVPQIPSSHYDVQRHLQLLQEEIVHLNADNYRAFELSQVLGFSRLEEAFVKEESLKTSLFPSSDEVKKLEYFQEEKEYLEALKVLLMDYPSWLDGWYFLVQNTDKDKVLEQYKIILNTLKYKLINFINDNEKNIHNYMPKEQLLRNKTIKEWVNLEKKSLTFFNKNGVYEEEYANALELFKEKKKEEAIQLLDAFQKNSKSDKESFLWRLKQSYLAVSMGNTNMAVALLYELDRDIEAFNLMKWNPKLATEVYILILKPSITKILSLEIKELFYRKLCRLSPKDASSIGFL